MIDVFPQKAFRELVPDSEVAVISIQSPKVKFGGGLTELDTTFSVDGGWKRVMLLRFHDVLDDDPDQPFTVFSPRMAKATWEFIKENQERDFVIHCDAGVSRSVAMACFISDNFEKCIQIHSGGRREFMNIHVYNLLRRAMMADYYND